MKILLRLLSIRQHGKFVMLGTVMFMMTMANVIILAPYLVKLTGMYMPAALLAGISTVKAIRDLFLTYLDHWNIKKAGLIFCAVEVLFVGILLIAYVDEKVFIYALTISVLFTSMLGSIFGILYDDHVSTNCKVGEFKEIQLMERAWFALSNISMGGLATFIYACCGNMVALTITVIIAAVSAMFVIYFYVSIILPLENDTVESKQLTFDFLEE